MFGGVGLGPLTRATAVMPDVGLAVVITTVSPTPVTALPPTGEFGAPARRFRHGKTNEDDGLETTTSASYLQR